MESSGYLHSESDPAGGNRLVLYIGASRKNRKGAEDGLLKLDAETGEPLWFFRSEKVYSSPLVDMKGRAVYFGSKEGGLHAVDTATGDLVWSVDLGGDIKSSVAQGPDGTLFVGSNKRRPGKPRDAAGEDPMLHAIDSDPAASERVLWSKGLERGVEATPALGFGDDYLVYIGDHLGRMYALDPADGSVAWQVDMKARDSKGRHHDKKRHIHGPAATTPDGIVYFAGDTEELHALDAASGEILWTFEVDGEVHGGITVDGRGTLYVGTKAGTLYALRPGAGVADMDRVLWSVRLRPGGCGPDLGNQAADRTTARCAAA